MQRVTSGGLRWCAGLAMTASIIQPAFAEGEAERFSREAFQKQWLEKKGFGEKAGAELESVATDELVHQALLRFDPSYQQACKVAINGKVGVQVWGAILGAGELDPYFEAEARIRLGKSYLLSDDFEKAAEQFELVEMKLGAFTPRLPESRLYQAYAFGRLEDPGRALRILDEMQKRYPDAPERILETAHWFKRELKGQGTGPLLELSKSMEVVRRLLGREETGFNPTGKRQQDIIHELNRLIDLLENKKKGDGDCKDCKGKGCKKCEKPGSKPGSNPSAPLPDSRLPGGSSDIGALGRDPERGSSEAWGKLKDAERQQVIQALKERFPGQYKELIEQYFKAMSDRAATGTGDR